MKRSIPIIISISILTIIALISINLIYGSDTIYIADYEPGISYDGNIGKEEPFISVALKNLIKDMPIIILINLLPTVICLGALFKTKILSKSKKDIIIIVLIAIIPIVISSIKLFYQYGSTC